MASTNDTGVNGQGAPAQHAFEFEFHSPDFHTPEDVVRYAREKLEHKLHKYGHRVLGAIVHMRDVNGPKGGDGLVCHVEVRLAGLAPCNVQEQEHDLRAALDLAIERIAVVVGRHIDRARTAPMDEGRKLAQASKLTEG